MFEQPKLKGYFPPGGGWLQSTWYIVDVKWAAGNPVHRNLFFTGFLNKGEPAGYSGCMAVNYADDEIRDHRRAYYLKAVKPILNSKGETIE